MMNERGRRTGGKGRKERGGKVNGDETGSVPTWSGGEVRQVLPHTKRLISR